MSSAGWEHDPPWQRVGLAEPFVAAMGLVERVDHQQGRRIPLGEKYAKGSAQPGPARIGQLVERARHDCWRMSPSAPKRREQVV